MYLMSLGLLSMSLPGVLSERHSSAGIYSACGSLVSDGASRVSVDCVGLALIGTGLPISQQPL